MVKKLIKEKKWKVCFLKQHKKTKLRRNNNINGKKKKKNLVGKNIKIGWIHLEVQLYIRKGKNEFSKRRI